MKDYKAIVDAPDGRQMRITLHSGVVPTSSENPTEDGLESAPRSSRTMDEEPNEVLEHASSTLSNSKETNTPDFLLLGHQKDIVYSNWGQPPTIKGGTLLALVEQLTRHDELDSDFNDTFLLTYPRFTTARELFTLLVERFHIQPPQGTALADYETWQARLQQPVRCRVLEFLKRWLDASWAEDGNEATRALLQDIHAFAKDAGSVGTPGSRAVMVVLEERLYDQRPAAGRLVPAPDQPVAAPVVVEDMEKLGFLDVDAVECARQLTIMESAIYREIKPRECSMRMWRKEAGEDEAQSAPNIKALILHSNQITNWMAGLILDQQAVKERVAVIEHFVSVAKACRELNNFSTLAAIICGFGATPIHRLKHTWCGVPARSMSDIEQMRSLLSSTRGFLEYKTALQLAKPPCVPFFGLSLTDLTFIEQGIPSTLEKSGMINFSKYTKIANVIRDVQRYQSGVYALQPVPRLQKYILSGMQAASDVHDMHARSLSVEP